MDDHDPTAPYVQSLARGLAVIRAFDAEHPRMTLSELAVRTELTRATARRFLHTLVDLGYVTTDGRTFQLTPRVLELGYSYLASLSLPELMQGPLEELSRQTGESTSGSVLDGSDIVYIARVPVRRIMAVSITIGTRFPASATSMGRVLLAGRSDTWLDEHLTSSPAFTPRTQTDLPRLREIIAEVRSQGWALVDQELEGGLRSIAAPVRGADGEVVAAVNIATTTSTVGTDRILGEFLPRLLVTAHAIGESIVRSGSRPERL
ncbi:IclR family transcriptional regulator C-terminal domain-containing protein [Leifsonia sp. H3M29-4]|uniref:IclR family transcriptional regulator domain-containing protein n=1 Tax=Salinibacterium metalliresistens TaxID=3031321 RepID=UPI0023DB41C9|nr:IclR family transcriptional regulator C-terminal domain-containing protein [Salinibacterium metalliresistens]MDF1478304.1 IclR family transcriptional regulator C-terminal domain-containing protein [Salinibacterium metalliresistens]